MKKYIPFLIGAAVLGLYLYKRNSSIGEYVGPDGKITQGWLNIFGLPTDDQSATPIITISRT